MAKRGVGALAVAIAVIALSAALGFAGVAEDPSLGDDFTGNAGKLRYAQDAVLADAGAGLAGCGSGPHRLIGGGMAVGGPANESFLGGARGYEYPQGGGDPDAGWYALAEGPPGTAVSATAICRKGGKLRYLQEEIPTNGTQLRSGEIDCGGRKWQVTTGSAFLSTFSSWVHSSYPVDDGDRKRVPDDGWAVRVFTQSVGGAFVHAICAKKLDLRYKQRAASTIGTTSVSDRTENRDVSCGKRRNVVGGGADVSGLINRGRLLVTAPVDSGDRGDTPDDRWHVTAYNLGGSSTTMKPFAICLQKKRKKG